MKKMEEMPKWPESCKTNNITLTYRRHHWRHKRETENRNEQGDEKGEVSGLEDVQVISSSISAISPVSLFGYVSTTPKPSSFWDVPAPATPDIVARYGKASATDANECSHSKKRTCCRSLNLDTRNLKRKARTDFMFDDLKTSEKEYEAKDIGRPRTVLVYRRRHAKNLVQKKAENGTQNRLISAITALPNELKGPNKRVKKKLAKTVIEISNTDGILRATECNGESDEKEERDLKEESVDGQIKLFLSRLNHIQGERKFSEWKGSVMDSIVGAFLAQNVNDAISSPAFMSLAAKFPRDAASVVLNMNGKKNNTAGSKSMQKEYKILRMRTKKKHNPALLNDMKDCHSKYQKEKKMSETLDAVDWDSVRTAKVKEISKAIHMRGMSNHLAERIKDCLEQLVKNFGSTDMEWIRDVPPLKAKEYLLSIYGLGLKSVECIRLLTLRHKAFPIDRNAGRVVLRLGWYHLINEHPKLVPQRKGKWTPKMNLIQMYLWPHLSHLKWSILYELHCQLITFGKVFCTEKNPNCYECPMRAECTHFASVEASTEVKSKGRREMDIEDHGLIRPQTRLCASETASIRVVKKRKNSLRTEHQVYVLPSGHYLLAKLESIQLGLGDLCPYLLAVWTRENLEKDGCIPDEDAVYGTLLIPARAATGGTFPLNGTFFQSNEVFADDESSAVPIKVPRASLTDLPSTTLYCGNSASSICKGMTCTEVRKCYKSGFTCFRGFNLKTREPKPLPAKFHNRAPCKAGKPRGVIT
ncbi:DEMETER-like DNA glycosylase [Salvia divinorum]|uniref:DEMETER-like DNA glycosylase n=1 Tax=Salvia divinorum TaxID=28513 RepID=A0ABD1G0D6_SALDI